MLAKNTWVMHDGKEYYFNGNGIMQRDKWVDTDYYVDANGVKRKNFFYEDGKNIYYLQEDGKYARGGILDLNSKSYVFEDDGKLVRNTVWEMASPSYAVYVEKDGTIRKKLGYYDIDNGKTIYINDESTGKISRNQWVKNDKSGKYNFFDKDGEMAKSRIVVEYVNDFMPQYTSYKNNSPLETSLMKIILGVVDKNLSLVNYYVDEDGNMLVDCFKTIDGLGWNFDKDGKASIDLWEQKNYTNTKEPFIANAKYIDGLYFYDSIDKSEEAYLTVIVDKSDIAFFLCKGSEKKQVKNNYNYIDDNYKITMYSKVCDPSYKFTGTMSRKGDRIYVDQHQAVTTILNHLNTGTGFIIKIEESGSYYPITYEFYVEPQNFNKMYEIQFEYKNGWKGDSYYVNNFKVLNQWQEYNGDWYYLGPNGVILKDQWVDNEYYVDKEGKMLKNTTTPDGYRVDENGKYVEKNTMKVSGSTTEEIGDIEFKIPEYYDVRVTNDDVYNVHFYPEREDAQASLGFVLMEQNYSAEQVKKSHENIVNEWKKRFANIKTEEEMRGNNYILKATGALDGGKMKGAIIVNDSTKKTVCVVLTVDDTDTTNIDYFKDFDDIINNAIIKTEK